MSKEQREAFLADLHVGVISIERADAAPLSVPIWYRYESGVGVWVITGDDSRKGRALQAAGRYSMCAQTEAPPFYSYVSVSGPITETRPATLEGDLRPMAHRYFGESLGDMYVKDNTVEGQSVFVMRPEKWLTVDYGNMQDA
jgi:hypothetical protein